MRLKMRTIGVLLTLIALNLNLAMADSIFTTPSDQLIQISPQQSISCLGHRSNDDIFSEMLIKKFNDPDFDQVTVEDFINSHAKGFTDNSSRPGGLRNKTLERFELAAIAAYTVGIRDFNTSLRGLANGTLKIEDFHFAGWIKALCSAVTKLESFNGETYRGVRLLPENILKLYVPGNIIVVHGFMSSSKNIEVAKDFAKSDGIIFKIHSINGKSISALSSWNLFEDEDEVLFAASSVFLVKSIQYNKVGKIRQIELQETMP